MKSAILEKIAGAVMVVFWFAGMVGIIRLILTLIPILEPLSYILSIVVPCVIGFIYYHYIEDPAQREKQQLYTSLAQAEARADKLQNAIHSAIVSGNVDGLYFYCDTEWLNYYRRKIDAKQAEHERVLYLNSLEECEPPDEK